VIQAAAENAKRAAKTTKRKNEDQGSSKPASSKLPRTDGDRQQEQSTNESDTATTPVTKNELKPKVTSTSAKGLSTQKAVIEKHIRQAASSVLATINPSVPLSLKEKREKLAELKKVGAAEPVKTASPEEQKFLSHVFQSSRKEWPAGYEDGLILLNPPPTIEMTVPSTEDTTKTTTVRTCGPVPKLDPDFLVPALNGYSAAKLHTGQVMTKFDHHFRTWMQHVVAVAVGLAPALGMELPKLDDVPEKEIEHTGHDGSVAKVPNPAYKATMLKFGEKMAEFLPELQLRLDSATDAAEGLNVLYENIRHQRHLNFVNEVL
jgi:hypothetical protein